MKAFIAAGALALGLAGLQAPALAQAPKAPVYKYCLQEMGGFRGSVRLPLQLVNPFFHFFARFERDHKLFRDKDFLTRPGVAGLAGGSSLDLEDAEVPQLDSLRLPPVVKKFCDYHQGLVLVTGPTGTGKSTTLAAMIDHLNRHRKLNIVSLEDPIEFVHRSKLSQVIQRELHSHLPSFAEGVLAAMREDPDVILVGELRDADTVRWAMTAAETGHLVLGTLHTTSAVKTVDRVVDALPAEEREQTKAFLAQSLIGVVTQVLVKTPDLRGRRAVCEVMTMNKAIGKLIQTDQTHMIASQLQTGKEAGMQLMDMALLQAVIAREVDPEDAFVYALDKRPFTRYVPDGTAMLKADVTQGVAG